MSRLLVWIAILCVLVNAASNRFSNLQMVSCANDTDTTCFQNLSYLAPKWLSVYPNPLLIVTDIQNYWQDNSQACDPDGTTYTFSLTIKERFMNTTCSQYFCGDGSAINATQFDKTNQIYRHNSYRDFCYYCNTPDRQTFKQLLAANKCPYFWKHNDNICQEAGVKSSIVTMDNSMVQANLYLNYRKSLDPTLQLDLNSFNDVLNLTILRNANNDHLGEVDRGEFIYLCYCSTFNRYGSRCDVYTRLVVPYNNELLPYIFAVMFSLVAAFFFFIIVVPILIKNLTFGMGKSAGQAVQQTLKNMTVYVSVYIFLSMVCVALTQFLIHIRESASVAAAIFSVLSFVTLGLAIGHLLVYWSHIYDKSCKLKSSETSGMSKKNLLILALFYLTLIGMLALAIMGFIIYKILEAVGSPNTLSFYIYFNMVLYIVVVLFLFGFSVGFFFYGFKMYLVLNAIENIPLFSLRLTKAMIFVTVTFIHMCFWVIVFVISTAPQMVMGPFLGLYAMYFLHLSMLVAYCAVAFPLFNSSTIRKAYKCWSYRSKAHGNDIFD